ncbi:MAG: hypothetical protein R3F17_04000 [Planctomycetota bacterium]
MTEEQAGGSARRQHLHRDRGGRRKARQLIRRVVREAPGTAVCVTGCLAESEPDVLRELPGVQWVLGNGEAKRPVQFLRELGHDIDPEELGIPSGITEFQGHTRAFLKIQDGCDQACSFCIIPSVRGRSKSRPLPELQAEVTRLVQAGHVGRALRHPASDIGVATSDSAYPTCSPRGTRSPGPGWGPHAVAHAPLLDRSDRGLRRHPRMDGRAARPHRTAPAHAPAIGLGRGTAA